MSSCIVSVSMLCTCFRQGASCVLINCPKLPFHPTMDAVCIVFIIIILVILKLKNLSHIIDTGEIKCIHLKVLLVSI